MEYVAGETLQQLIPPGTQLASDEVKRYLAPAADAIHYAHVNNVLHKNLHPGNLLFAEHNTLLVTDFSLALPNRDLLLDDEDFAIPYMAPEHLQGQPTSASDQYSLAVMAYEWLCGRRPYEATERNLLLQQQKQVVFPLPSSLNDAVSPAVERVLVQALSYDATARFPHTLEFFNQYLGALMGFPVKTISQPVKPVLTPAFASYTSSPASTVQPIEEVAKDKTALPEDAENVKVRSSDRSSSNGETDHTNAKSTLSGARFDTDDLLNWRYRIVEQRGKDSSGVLYTATDGKMENHQVTIREFASNKINTQEIEKYSDVVQATLNRARNFHHQNLPHVHDFFIESNYAYLVTDFVEGETLAECLAAKKSLLPERVVDVGVQIASVLVDLSNQKAPIALHSIEPSTIIINSSSQICLVDIGLPLTFDEPAKNAPEDIFSSSRSVIHKLGITLYQLLSETLLSKWPSSFKPLQLGNQPSLMRLEDLVMDMLDTENAFLSIFEIKREFKRIAAELELVATADPEQIFKELAAKPAASPNGKTLHSIVEDDLRQGGVLSQQLPGYEERPAQIEMATVVARSLTQSVPSIIEASTGTGKSLAYLLPIVRSSKVAIVSTANKALQEQLFYKDIPFVQKHIKPFEAALVKGAANYVCLDRVESERVGMQFYAKNRDFKRLLTMIEDPDSTFTGDFETLGFQLPGDIRSRVATDSDQCAWSKCEFFGDCYVRRMRARAERAQVIVVNHTLLLLDAAMEGFLLPERDVIVLDEAHHLEEEATRSFTVTIGPMQVQTLLAQKMLKDHTLLHLQDETLQAAEHMWSRLYQVANPGFKGRANLTEPLEEGLRLATRIGDLADSLRKQRPKNLAEKEDQLYDKLLKRAQNLAENVRMVFSVAQPDKFVYYVERAEASSNRVTLQASAAPLDVTTWLKERLFNKSNVICTSATLATIGPNPARPEDKGPNFAYFRRRTGLDPLERADVLESILPLTFDYENNALLYLPRDLPEPAYGQGSDDYMKAVAREMYKLVKLSRGRAFLLFSSKRMLDRAYELMSPHLPYPLLKQGDQTRLELTRRFREEEGAVLFGLKSFWEGVDIAGEALSLVVIDKLPFDPPDDPVHEARVAQMKAAGENWFGIYVLPQAVLRLKQGLGRLLRTRDDRGVMAILDTRLHTKGYGKMVLNALPPARRTASLRDVERFFMIPSVNQE